MKDRIPYPGQAGRVLIKHEDGAEEYAILEMADNPSEPGMELKKVNLLTDDTATLIGLDPTDDPTPNDALAALHTESNSAAGVARAIAFDGNVNDTAMRSALGEFTPYADTHGLGYALYMYGIADAGLDKETASTVRDALMLCKDRQQIAASADAIDALGKLPKSRELWRKYAFTVKGKTTEIVTDYGYTGLIRNPINGYLYGFKLEDGHSYTSCFVSRDGGKTWEYIMKNGSAYARNDRYGKIAFSSDYKYVYYIETGSDVHTFRYSTDGVNFSNTYTSVGSTSYATALICDHIFMFKLTDGKYVFFVDGDGGTYWSRLYTKVSDGMTINGNLSCDDTIAALVHVSYVGKSYAYPLKDGVLITWAQGPASNSAGNPNTVAVMTIQNKDGEDVSQTKKETLYEADDDYGDRDEVIEVQQAEDGTIYLRAEVITRNNGSVLKRYKVTQSGEITELDDTTEFPAMQDGDYGLVYALPQGQAYIPYISSYTGKLVKDNWGAVADGTQVMPVFGTDQRESFKDGKITAVYGFDEKIGTGTGKLTVTGFGDEEAQ